MSESKNSKINEGIVDQSGKKTQFITLSTPGVYHVSIMSKQSETSMRVTSDKEVFRPPHPQTQIVDKGDERNSSYPQNKEIELSYSPTEIKQMDNNREIFSYEK